METSSEPKSVLNLISVAAVALAEGMETSFSASRAESKQVAAVALAEGMETLRGENPSDERTVAAVALAEGMETFTQE